MLSRLEYGQPSPDFAGVYVVTDHEHKTAFIGATNKLACGIERLKSKLEGNHHWSKDLQALYLGEANRQIGFITFEKQEDAFQLRRQLLEEHPEYIAI